MARVSKLQTSRNKSMPIIDQLTAAAATAETAGNTQKRVAKVGQTKNNWPAESAAEEATPATTKATSAARHKTLALANLLQLKDSKRRQLCSPFFLVYQQWGISD